MISALRALLIGGLVLLLLWVPLPWASVRPSGVAIVRVASLLLLAVALTLPEAGSVLRRLRWPLATLAGLALLGVLQSLPWPPALVELASPRHAALAAEEAVTALAGEGAWPRLSLSAEASRSAALTWLSLAALLAAAAIAGRSRAAARWLLPAIVVASLVQLTVGARSWLAGTSPRLSGTFYNANHLAMLLEIAVAVALATCWWLWRRTRYAATTEERLTALLPAGVVLAGLFAGLAFTGSRSGLLAGVLGLTAQAVVIATGRRRAGRWWLGLLPPAVLLGGLAVVGREAAFWRLVGATTAQGDVAERLEVWRATLELFGQFPLSGAGLGSFPVAFPLVQPPGLAGVRWMRAHSDPLELLATAGVIGFALALAAAVTLARPIRASWRRSRPGETRAVALAALGAAVAVGLHELFDFGLTLPANAVTLAVLLGLAAGASSGRRRVRRPRPSAAPLRPASPDRPRSA